MEDMTTVGFTMKGYVWVCEHYPKCDSYVGCHSGTDIPLGTMAGPDLRAARMRAHKSFDWIWKTKKKTRHEAYAMLQEFLGLPPERAHIGMLDVEQCHRVVQHFRAMRPYKTPKR